MLLTTNDWSEPAGLNMQQLWLEFTHTAAEPLIRHLGDSAVLKVCRLAFICPHLPLEKRRTEIINFVLLVEKGKISKCKRERQQNLLTKMMLFISGLGTK